MHSLIKITGEIKAIPVYILAIDLFKTTVLISAVSQIHLHANSLLN